VDTDFEAGPFMVLHHREVAIGRPDVFVSMRSESSGKWFDQTIAGSNAARAGTTKCARTVPAANQREPI